MSKGLEALNFIVFNCYYYENLGWHQKVIEYELLVLEILKNKRVNLSLFLRDDCTLEKYNNCVEFDRELTQDEYDLCRGVLMNEKKD